MLSPVAMSNTKPGQASAEPPPGFREAGDSAPTTTAPPLGRRSWCGLLQRRECWGLTWRGRVALLLLCLALLAGAVAGAYPFLAVTEPAPSGLLVVEGWAPDYVLAVAQMEFETYGVQLCQRTEDHKEGIKSFMEKREPEFKGY